LEQILRNSTIPDWITLLIFCCLILLAFVKWLNSPRFNEFVMLVFTNKYFLVHGKNKNIFTPFNLLLLIVQILSVSLFVIILSSYFFKEIKLNEPLYFVQIAGFFTLFIGLKFYIEKIIANLFSIDIFIDNYLYHKLSYRNLIAIFLLGINMLLLYTLPLSFGLLITIVFLIVAANIFSLIYSYKTYEKLIRGHFFYFILYLCALEISPYFILYKIMV
jgi:hypothetical protein